VYQSNVIATAVEKSKVLSSLKVLFIPSTKINLCGLAWRVRRPLQLEIADMREAKLEEGTVAISFSSMSDKEASSCGVDGGIVANWRVCYYTFIIDTGLGPEGSGLTVGGWRSQGSDAEEDIEGLAGSEGLDRERARTNLYFSRGNLCNLVVIKRS
jgi:hypothetical protein